MFWLLLFVVGVIILLFSTYSFVKSAEKLSRSLQISSLIIGSTIVAVGTSLPELTVSLIALIEQDTGLALGNIIGSNIVNVLLILPLGILTGNLRVGTTKTQRNTWLLLGATALFIVLQKINISNSASGSVLLIFALIFTFFQYRLGVFGRTHEDAKVFNNQAGKPLSLMTVVKILLTIFGVICGGGLVVYSVENLSLVTGYSTTILGLSLTAVATSLPEALTTVFAQEDHQEKLTLGNIIGSNVYNLLLIGGIATLFSSSLIIPLGDWLWLAFSTLLFVFLLRVYSGKYLSKFIGWGLFLLFLAYLASLS